MNTLPRYDVLHRDYPDPRSVPIEELYRWIGHSEKLKDPLWHNTCAIRVSIALLGAGMLIPNGFLKIEAGKYKGRRVESSQRRLSDFLCSQWGEPEKFPTVLSSWRIGDRHGVVSFFQLWGPYDHQGHIDLIARDQWNRLLCEGSCYPDAVETWFWPLP